MPTSFCANVHLDHSVLHNGDVSIRDDPHTGADTNVCREVDSHYSFSVNPGDHIIFRIWMKTSSYSGSGGATLGWDWYGRNGRIGAIDNLQSDPSRWVSWGNDWTQRTIDLTVPKVVVDPDQVNPSQTPTSIILWIGALPWTAPTGTAWFADAELYINP
jgi:hypothetical protein